MEHQCYITRRGLLYTIYAYPFTIPSAESAKNWKHQSYTNLKLNYLHKKLFAQFIIVQRKKEFFFYQNVFCFALHTMYLHTLLWFINNNMVHREQKKTVLFTLQWTLKKIKMVLHIVFLHKNFKKKRLFEPMFLLIHQ